MAPRAAEILVDTLYEWGVEVIFGLPGDGINGIMEALRTNQNRIRFVQVRHEETAAFMAAGYAKFTGKLGVCLATSGPGGLHLVNGLYDAKMDGQPVLAITGHQNHDLIDTFGQQDVDLCRVFQDVAVYNTRVMGAAHVQNVTNLACRSAISARGVSHINFPTDLQDEELKQDPRSMRNVAGHAEAVHHSDRPLPSSGDLHAAAEVLNAGTKVTILVGQGALGAGKQVELIAERLGAPVVKALLGKGVVPDDSPYTTGGIGLLGTAPSYEVMKACDTLLIVGSSFPYIEHYPKPNQARAVQIDINPVRIGLRYPVEVGLVGDAGGILDLLGPLLKPHEDRSFLESAQKGMREWSEVMRERGESRLSPMKPQVVAWELGKRLAPDAIVTSDSGTITTWWARQIPAQAGQMYSCSGNLATMACGMPYALAAQVAYPRRQVVAFVGDGGFSMLMADFVTAVKYQLPVKVIVIKNNVLGQIKWEQISFLGNPDFGIDLAPIDFAMFAKACGGTGLRIERAEECGGVIEEALKTPGPVLVEAVVDPLEPPLPGHTTMTQVKQFMKAILRGQPESGKILQNAMREKARELV
jgi:pyruvate dehydrogenase (quinone)